MLGMSKYIILIKGKKTGFQLLAVRQADSEKPYRLTADVKGSLFGYFYIKERNKQQHAGEDACSC